MNKYQEAYEFLSDSGIVTAWGCENCDLLPKHLDTVRELVDKATPKAPDFEGDGYDDKGNMNYDTWICPNCEKRYEVDYEEYDYCPNCGQKIDWSKEEGLKYIAMKEAEE